MKQQTQMGRSKWDFLIVLTVLITILLIIFGIIFKYNDWSQAKAMLEFILPSIVAIASAAFGISQAGRAKTAENETKNTKELAQNALSELKSLEGDIEPPFNLIETAMTSPVGSKAFKFDLSDSGKVQGLTLPADALTSARKRIASIEARLEQIVET